MRSVYLKQSIFTKILCMMLMIGILPTIILTLFASMTTYRALNEQLIQVNTDGMTWCEDRLTQYLKDIKNTVYYIELDENFKNSVLQIAKGNNTYYNYMPIKTTLDTYLNKSDLASTITVFFLDQSFIQAKNTGVITGIDTEGFTKGLTRGEDLQRNLFFKPTSNGIYAVHYINQFESRTHLATLALQLRTKQLEDILQKIQSNTRESIYLLNDENELLMYLGEEEKQLSSVEDIAKNMDERGNDGYFNQEDKIIFYNHIEEGDLKVIKITPRDVLIEASMSTVGIGIGIGAGCIVGAVMLAIILTYLITRPIVKLTDKVKNISLETLEVEASGNNKNEVGVLEDHIALLVGKIRELIKNEYQMKIEAKSSQINALQAQINPHFLHNTLQLMGGIALAKGAKEVYTIAGALSHMMRYNMNFEQGFVTLKEELKHLDHYLFIQKQRFYDRFTLETTIQKEVEHCLIPKMILQPIVENSFQHGFEKSSGNWKLWIDVAILEDKKVHIKIRDNGVGINSQVLETLNERLEAYNGIAIDRGEHIGLVNVNSRIKLHFSDEDGIKVTSSEGIGTEVEIVVEVVTMR